MRNEGSLKQIEVRPNINYVKPGKKAEFKLILTGYNNISSRNAIKFEIEDVTERCKTSLEGVFQNVGVIQPSYIKNNVYEHSFLIKAPPDLPLGKRVMLAHVHPDGPLSERDPELDRLQEFELVLE